MSDANERCARCGWAENALGGDVHCSGDCDDNSHNEPDGCHAYVAPAPVSHPAPAQEEKGEDEDLNCFLDACVNCGDGARHRLPDEQITWSAQGDARCPECGIDRGAYASGACGCGPVGDELAALRSALARKDGALREIAETGCERREWEKQTYGVDGRTCIELESVTPVEYCPACIATRALSAKE